MGEIWSQKWNLKKKLGYLSIENRKIPDGPCVAIAVVNPKEYLEEFESQSVNEKHKRPRKGASRVEFEDYAKNSIRKIETFGQLP